MKAAIFQGTRNIEVVDLPIPKPGKEEILVKVDYCGICGSDLHTYTKGLYVKPGQVMGHEFAGVVTQVGEHVSDIQVGQRVAIRPYSVCGHCMHCIAGRYNFCKNRQVFGYSLPGAFAEYILIPKPLVGSVVYPLPPEVSTKEAALLEPLSIAIHAVNLANIGLNDTVVIFGAGSIGLFVAQLVKMFGGCHVIQVDLSERRLDAAKSLGVDTVINPRKENVIDKIAAITGKGNNGMGASADVVFECAGVPITVNQAIDSLRHGGQIISLALFEENVSFDPTILVQKELAWKGAFSSVNDEFQTSINLVKSGKVKTKELISHFYSIDEAMEAFRKQLDSSDSLKVCFEI